MDGHELYSENRDQFMYVLVNVASRAAFDCTNCPGKDDNISFHKYLFYDKKLLDPCVFFKRKEDSKMIRKN